MVTRNRTPRFVQSLRRKPEMHHVAVGDLVLLAFEPQLPGLARAGLAAALDVIVVGDGLGADEAALEIGVDRARRLRRARPLGHGPGARLLRAGGKERDEVQQRVAGADQAAEARAPPSALGQAKRARAPRG